MIINIRSFRVNAGIRTENNFPLYLGTDFKNSIRMHSIDVWCINIISILLGTNISNKYNKILEFNVHNKSTTFNIYINRNILFSKCFEIRKYWNWYFNNIYIYNSEKIFKYHKKPGISYKKNKHILFTKLKKIVYILLDYTT